eukprot:219779_1
MPGFNVIFAIMITIILSVCSEWGVWISGLILACPFISRILTFNSGCPLSNVFVLIILQNIRDGCPLSNVFVLMEMEVSTINSSRTRRTPGFVSVSV